MARPEPRALAAVAAWCAVAVVGAVRPGLAALEIGAGAVLAALLVVDLLRARSRPTPSVMRRVPAVLPQRTTCRVSLRLTNPVRSPLRLELFDHHPPSGEARDAWQRIELPPRGAAEMAYSFRPLERGEWRFEPVDLLILSPWRLWGLRRRAGHASVVRVLPDFGAVRGYAILAVSHRTAALGVRRRQRRGEGLELHELRDYRLGDALRQIDWKATSRRRKLISREYEEERNQQLVFLLDCGRSMRAKDGGVAHFDHALNSILLMSYVALRQGDAVGLMTMGGPDRWIAPLKGPAAMRVILEGVYGLETSPAATDFSEAAVRLMGRQRRRALVVWISNLRAEDAGELGSALDLLRRRHLVLLASLREAVLDRMLERPIGGFDDALLAAATLHYVAARRRAHESLRSPGLPAVDVVPADLPVTLVNRYLEAKRSGLL